jgi:DNA-binding response OmpR family regulator
MSKHSYESAGTLIFDPVASNRNATRASLHSLGFRRVDLAPSLDILAKQLCETSPDLLLAEVTGFETEICQFVQSIRQGEMGSNPFMVIIVTTWRRDGAMVGKVINCGADDLAARPISTSMLGDRIKLQIERRKGFVVTSDYIGPDRRRDTNRGGDIECMEVPNSLRMRALSGLANEDSERRVLYAVEMGKQTLNEQKIKRTAVQLCTQWRILEQKSQGTPDFFDTIAQFGKIASDIQRRLPFGNRNGAGDLCGTISQAIETIETMKKNSGTAGTDLELDYGASLDRLGQAALGLGKIFAPGETGSANLTQIAASAAQKRTEAA